MIFKIRIKIFKILSKFSRRLENSSIGVRRSYQLLLDLIILLISTFLSLKIVAIDFNEITNKITFYVLITTIGLLIYIFSGQYKGLTKYRGSYFQYFLIARNTTILFTTFLFCYLFNNEIFFSNENLWITLWFIMNFFSGSSRIIIRDAILNLRVYRANKINVLIYGAGDAGSQLAKSLNLTGKYKVLAFLDDNKELWDRNIFGIKIISPNLVNKYKNIVNQILVAIPSLSIKRKKEILNQIYSKNYSVLQVPSLDDITSGKLHINNLKPITIKDLLGRKKVFKEEKPNSFEFSNKVIFVTGAGGSIGSELSRQIIKMNPNKLILFDNCELNLYSINRELSERFNKIIPILGNASDKNLLKKLFNEFNVDIVLHAAAYKHVPLVENNPIEGIKNNVFSSLAICQASEKSNVKKIILISSDKAVRPTNLMGVSKRISEQIFQSFAFENNIKSSDKIYSMVRFGNVLGSSGSVIPLFKEQINNGGPITITHPEVERYFMTIPEASHLVLQTAKMAKGGEIFLLDMGTPVKIKELAKQMVKLSGLNIKDENNLNGDINIEYIGLRPGEKLYEELLISGESTSTNHPQIFCAKESFIKFPTLKPLLEELAKNLSDFNEKGINNILHKIVPEWKQT